MLEEATRVMRPNLFHRDKARQIEGGGHKETKKYNNKP